MAQLATVAFQNAFARWIDARGQEDFAACLHAVAASLRDEVNAGTSGEDSG